MMRRTDTTWPQVKVGVVLILGIAAILYTIMNLNSGMGVFTAASTFHASLTDSQGIKVGAPVRISGVDVGNVKGVSIDAGKGSVVIEFTVNNDMRPLLHDDAAIMIRPMGLLGDKYLDLLDGSPKLPGPRLQLLEEADVLDGDHGLIGERSDELDLFLRERAHFRSANQNGPNGDALAQQRRAKRCPMALEHLSGLHIRELGFELCRDVVDVDRLAVDHSSARYPPSADGASLPSPKARQYCSV